LNDVKRANCCQLVGFLLTRMRLSSHLMNASQIKIRARYTYGCDSVPWSSTLHGGFSAMHGGRYHAPEAGGRWGNKAWPEILDDHQLRDLQTIPIFLLCIQSSAICRSCALCFFNPFLAHRLPHGLDCWPSPVFGDRVPWVSSFQHQPAGTSANTPSRSFKPCNALQVLWLRSEGTGSSFPRSSALRSGRCTVSCTFEMEWPWPESVQLAGVETPHQIWDPSFNGISIASLNKCLVDLYVCWILCGVDEMLITFCAASMQGDKSFSLWPWQNCKFYW